jgi:hypothetical protein
MPPRTTPAGDRKSWTGISLTRMTPSTVGRRVVISYSAGRGEDIMAAWYLIQLQEHTYIARS